MQRYNLNPDPEPRVFPPIFSLPNPQAPSCAVTARGTQRARARLPLERSAGNRARAAAALARARLPIPCARRAVHGC